VTDFLTLRQAAEKQVYLPDRAAFGNPNPDIAWPAVEFIQPKYAVKRDVRRVLIPQMSVDVLNAMGEPEATRFQVPLILSFAITIHKSQ
jgi:ATP-dependent DNA helicase PIF1